MVLKRESARLVISLDGALFRQPAAHSTQIFIFYFILSTAPFKG
jgi:hypothetical protein